MMPTRARSPQDGPPEILPALTRQEAHTVASETTLINRAMKALAAGDPQPVLELVASGVLPTDAPIVAEAWQVKRTIRTGSRALLMYPAGDVDWVTVTALSEWSTTVRLPSGALYTTVPEDLGIGVDEELVAVLDDGRTLTFA